MRALLRLGTGVIDTRLKSGYAFRPYYVFIQPTLRCNLGCKMCIQNGEHGYLKDRPELRRNHLDLDQWEKIISEFSPVRPFIHVWGGEPLIYKDIDGLLKLLGKAGMPIMITTNAILFEQHWEALRKVQVLRFSLDGPEEVHDKVRNKAGAFKAVIKSIEKVMEYRRSRKGRGPLVTVNSMILDTSYKHIYEMADMLAGLRVDHVDFSLPMFTTPERAKAYKKTMKTSLGCEAVAGDGFLVEGLGIDIDELKDALLRVKQNDKVGRFALFPIGRITGIDDYYSDLSQTFRFNKCLAPWYSVNILPDGDLTPCNDVPDYIYGNAAQDGFMNVWNSEKARKMRNHIQNNNILPICARCCLLFSHPIFKMAWNLRKMSV